MNKERLAELLHLMAMGRRDGVEELAEMLSFNAPAPIMGPQMPAPVPAPDPVPVALPGIF